MQAVAEWEWDLVEARALAQGSALVREWASTLESGSASASTLELGSAAALEGTQGKGDKPRETAPDWASTLELAREWASMSEPVLAEKSVREAQESARVRALHGKGRGEAVHQGQRQFDPC